MSCNRVEAADDRIGLAGAVNALSPEHRDYIAAGGLGVLIGDGMLNYHQERILETYYAMRVLKGLTMTFDYQYMVNPRVHRRSRPNLILLGPPARRVLTLQATTLFTGGFFEFECREAASWWRPLQIAVNLSPAAAPGRSCCRPMRDALLEAIREVAYSNSSKAQACHDSTGF